jgi:ferredoxin
VTWAAYLGCGVCVGQCPSGAKSLVRDESEAMSRDVREVVLGEIANS